MKYLCIDGHVFVHPAKLTLPKEGSEKSLALIQLGSMACITAFPTIEMQVCPVCESHIYTEFVEAEPEITSVKSVDLSQVDDYLKLGYVVRELYAKTATLVKTEASQA